MKEEKKVRGGDNFRGFYEGNWSNELNADELDGVAGGVDIISGKKTNTVIERTAEKTAAGIAGPFFDNALENPEEDGKTNVMI